MHIDDPVVPKKRTPLSYLPHAFIILVLLLALSGASLNFLWWLFGLFAVYVIIKKFIDWAPLKVALVLAGGLLLMLLVTVHLPPQYYIAGILATVLHGIMIFSGMFTEQIGDSSQEKDI